MNTRTKRIVFVTGYKGGTGRTTFARGLLDVYQHRGMNYQAYDTDMTNPQLHRHYPEATVINLTQDPVQWANNIENEQPDVALLDMSAGSGVNFEQLMQEYPIILAAEEMGYRLTLVSVIGRNKDSQNSLQMLMNYAGDRVDYVAVKNLWAGDEKCYERFDASDIRKQLMGLHGQEILLPKITGESYYTIDEHNLRFRAATQADSMVPLAQRSRIHKWLTSLEQRICGAGEYLGVVNPA
jgi:hypothetical protein